MLFSTIKYNLFFLCVMSYAFGIAQNDATSIFKKATNQLLTKNIELSIVIEETRNNGRVKEKEFNVLIGTFGTVEKTRTIIQKPDRAKGVTIVITSIPKEIGLIEIFTPSNGKIRKLKATQRNMTLVGSNSDILMSNYISRDPNELNITLIKKQEISGTSYYKLVVNEKGNNEKEKAEFLIEENTFHIVEVTSYDKNEVKKSITKFSDFESISSLKGKIQPKLIQSENLKNRTKNKIKILEITPRSDVKEIDFDLQKIKN